MRALSIDHQDDAGPGVFAEAMLGAGVELDRWPIADQAEPPADPHSYDVVLSFGGAMHADHEDKHPWLRPEKELLASLVEAGKPLMAVCLGAQLLAQATGGEARRMPAPEIGWLEVEVLPDGEGDPVFGPMAPDFTAFQWHSYECVPPAGAAILARSSACVQAFRVGERAWGIQFHPEVTAADADHWVDDWDEDEDAVASGIDPERLRAEIAAAIEPWNEVGRELCGRFLDQVARSTPA